MPLKARWQRKICEPSSEQVHQIDLEIMDADIETLMAALEQIAWRTSEFICPRVYYSLTRAQLGAIRHRAVALVHRAGGRVECGPVSVRSDGQKLWTEML